jgi:hypothetical protein
MPEAIKITSDNYIKFAACALSKGFALDQELTIQTIHGANAYTLRKDKQQLRVKIQILIAYWLRMNFPFVFKFTDRLLADGIETSWHIGGLEPECKKLFKTYLKSARFGRQFMIWLRILFLYLKGFIYTSRGAN